jgi:peptidoglycan-associated lipoprotein
MIKVTDQNKERPSMITRLIYITTLAAILTACSSTSEKSDSASVEDRANSVTSGMSDSESGGARTFGTGVDSRSGMSALDDPSSPLSVRILYYDYDSSEILPAYREVLEAHANYLAQNPNITISLEGHADERGSREYNLALGERRSQSAKRHMMLFGSASSQIRTTSYGEERPIADGHDEQSWNQNRRVEIIY